MPSERVAGGRERAQRRDTGPRGRVCVVWVRTRYVVARRRAAARLWGRDLKFKPLHAFNACTDYRTVAWERG